MNLKEEILNMQFSHPEWDLFTLVRWIYLKTCTIFTYDWRYFYEDDFQRKEIYDLTLDISHITVTDIICSTWAKLFADALRCLDIEAQIVSDVPPHCYVLFDLNGMTIKADATKGYDLSRVKIGCSTNGFKALHFNKDFLQKLDLSDEMIGYKQMLYTDEVIKRLKTDFLEDGYTNNQNSFEFANVDYKQIIFKIELLQTLINDTQKVNKFHDTDFYLSYLGRNLLTSQERYETLIQPYWRIEPYPDIVNFLAVRDCMQKDIYILKCFDDKYRLERATNEDIEYYVTNYHGKYEQLLLQYKKK